MKKLYTIIAAATMTIAAAASGSTLLSPGARPFEPRVAPAAQAPAGLELRQIPESGLAAPRKAQASLPARDAGWNEVGRAAFPEDFVQWVGNVLAQYGAEDHGWNSVFAVEVESDPNPESSTKMLRFRGVFNNADIYLDVDKSTGEIAGRGSTGIPIPGGPDAGLYEEFRFYVSGRYHEAAGRFIFDDAYILIDGDWGYRYPGPEFVLDGAPEVVFEVPESAFVPAEEQQAEIRVGRSANVAWYRVVVRERAMSSKELMAYYAKVPAYAPCAYADYTAESFAAMPFQSGIETKYYVIPFDSQGRALADYSMLRLFYNYDYHHGYNAEWRSLGAGRMEENAAHYGIPFDKAVSVSLFSSNPEVEMSADGSLLCVKNPFGPTHPAYGDLIPNTQAPRGEDFYMVFDVSDPTRVVALESLSGMIARYDNAQMAISCSARAMMDTGVSQDVIDNRRDNVWGKFADNRLTMPRYGAIGVSSGEAFSFTLELPGYVDYDVEVAEKGTLEGGVFRFPMSRVSPNVTTVDYALVPMADYEADHNFPERIIAAMADRYAVRSVAASELSASMALGIPDEEVPYGQWALAVVGRDAAGNRHAGMVFPDAVKKVRSLEEWEDAGIAVATDNSLQRLFSVDVTRQFKVRVLRNPDNPDILLLQDYYRNLFDSYGWEGFYEFHAEEADLFVLNLSGDYPVLT
ncbi:MAG: hypothetical protein K2O33_04165, partial [Muribaculaceae bacterium]|nr:hypothetical protein [Muribaculaceae bacterium]